MYKNYDLAHTKSDDFNLHVLMYTRLLKTYCIIKLFSFFPQEELLEFNKQQKLIETVMIDQLSR